MEKFRFLTLEEKQFLMSARSSFGSDDFESMRSIVCEFTKMLVKTRGHVLNVKVEDLEEIVALSSPIAFLIWQHLSAVERLSSLSKDKKDEVGFNEFLVGERLLGLATTYLRSPSANMVCVKSDDDFIRCDGDIPWITGHLVFDDFLFGFKLGDFYHFAVLPFIEGAGISFKPRPTIIFDEIGNVSARLEKYKFSSDRVLDEISIPILNPVKKINNYTFPELGLVKRMMGMIAIKNQGSVHPKFSNILACAERKYRDYLKIRDEIYEGDLSIEMSLRVSDLLDSSMELVFLAFGSEALARDSECVSTLLEIRLFRSLVQKPEFIMASIQRLESKLDART